MSFIGGLVKMGKTRIGKSHNLGLHVKRI